MPKNILDLTLAELEEQILELNEKKFRAEQIFKQIHNSNITGFKDLKNIPKELILKLEKEFYIGTLNLIEIKESEIDNTQKFLFEIPDSKYKIESVLIKDKERKTICVSTQVGCNAGCEFCATGKTGFKKNLSPGEIVLQVYIVSRHAGEKLTNIVFMGMGEPFLNYENVIASLKNLTNKKGYGISSKKITVSSIGFTGKIKKFADDLCLVNNKDIRNIKFALSLHSTDKGMREKLIPVAAKNPLGKIYEELNYFYKKTKNKVTFEYIFFDGLSDSEDDIKRLTKITRMFPCNINVIPFHPIDFELKSPLDRYNGTKFSLSKKNLFDFISKLKRNGVTVNLRNSSGVDIYAACGQLAGKYLQQNHKNNV